MINDYATL
jgi:hypothetical protein